jgi:iron complex outermembrane receptor protein
LGGVAIAAFASPALAAQGTPAASAPAAADASTSADGSAMADIIVTAQRRAERGQDVPIVISAFTPERLQKLNVNQPQDLYGTVPSLVSGTQGQASRDVQSFSIRGQSTGFLASPSVQSYLNEVPLPSTVSLSLQGGPGLFIDPENVQVLSGPQGTLFGRNTTGGAVLFSAKKPTNNFEGYLEGSIGNLNLRGVEGAINIPVISDVLMVRVAGAYHDRRGYTRDIVWNKWRDNEHWYTGRIGILFKPTDRLTNYLLAYGTKSSNDGSGFVNEDFNIPGLIARGSCTDGPTVPGGVASCNVYRRQTQLAQQLGPRVTRGDLDAFSKIDTWGVINNTAYELSDELTMRNIVSFQKLKDNYSGDTDGTPLQQAELSQGAAVPNFPVAGLVEFGLPATPGNVFQNGTSGFPGPRDNIKQFTEELQLQGSMLDKHLTFSVGGFYFNATPASRWASDAVQFCDAGKTGTTACGQNISISGVSNRSQALYGQGTLDLGALTPSLENLRVTAGYRYTWDRIIGFSSSYVPLGAFGNFCVFGPPAGTISPANVDPAVGCNYGATLKSKAPTWTFGVDYKPVQNLLVYAKVSRGYKSGGFNTFAVRASTQTFTPEKLTTFETGFKSDWHLGTAPLHLNATYYHSNYKNIQRPGGDFNLANGAGGAAIFAAAATIQGVEVEASVRPTSGVEIGSTVSYSHGKYKQYTLPSLGAASCNNAPFGAPADFSCAPFQFLTPWIYNIYTTIKLPVPESIGDASLFVSYSHVSDQYTAPGPFEPFATLKGYGLLNGSLRLNNIGGMGLDLSIFANNIADKVYRVSNSNSFSGSLYAATLYGEPRTFGAKMRYRF